MVLLLHTRRAREELMSRKRSGAGNKPVEYRNVRATTPPAEEGLGYQEEAAEEEASRPLIVVPGSFLSPPEEDEQGGRRVAEEAAEVTPAAEGGVALYIDWENLKYGLRQRDRNAAPNVAALLETARRWGPVLVARAYADWEDHEHHRTYDARCLYHAGIEAVYVACRTRGGAWDPEGSKARSLSINNSVDVRLTADAVETACLRPEIRTFVLVSGDHSLLHLLGVLAGRGKETIVIGVDGDIARTLSQRADTLLMYHDMLAVAAPLPRQSPGRVASDVYGDLVRTLSELKTRYPFVSAGKLAYTVWNKARVGNSQLPSSASPVSETVRGMSQREIHDYIEAAARDGLLECERRAGGGTPEVRLLQTGAPASLAANPAQYA